MHIFLTTVRGYMRKLSDLGRRIKECIERDLSVGDACGANIQSIVAELGCCSGCPKFRFAFQEAHDALSSEGRRRHDKAVACVRQCSDPREKDKCPRSADRTERRVYAVSLLELSRRVNYRACPLVSMQASSTFAAPVILQSASGKCKN